MRINTYSPLSTNYQSTINNLPSFGAIEALKKYEGKMTKHKIDALVEKDVIDRYQGNMLYDHLIGPEGTPLERNPMSRIYGINPTNVKKKLQEIAELIDGLVPGLE